MTELKVGARRVDTHVVAEEDVVTFMGPNARVLSSPRMILFMERACRDMVGETLPEGLATVGMHVNVWHRGAAPEGATVAYSAELISLTASPASTAPNRYEFRVEARMGDKLIGEGTHLRGQVDLSRFAKA
jgi:fluoroacetyl-CoA thioesterase